MLRDDQQTLWLDSELKRFYLVPDDVALPLGDFVIRNLFAVERRVDGEVLGRYEVTRAEVEGRIKAQFSDVASVVTAAFAGIGAKLSEALQTAPEVTSPRTELQRVSEESEPTGSTSAVPAAEKIQQGIEEVEKGLRDVVGGLQTALAEIVAKLPSLTALANPQRAADPAPQGAPDLSPPKDKPLPH